jgi:hypothetical protein
MTDRRWTDRAMTLAEMAPHASVTVGVLCGQESEFPGGRTCRPPVAYLEDTEAPAYVLTNAKRGVGLGTKRNTTEPAPDRGTVALVTGRRTLCLVGGGDGPEADAVIEVPHESVSEVTYKSGLLTGRFVLKTPRRQYHVWVPRATDEATLRGAADYVRERMDEDPEELEAEDGANALTYRGQPVSPENHPGVRTDSSGSDDSGSDGTAPRSDGEASQPEGRTFSYRGREVSPENHPGVRTGGTDPGERPSEE